MKKIKRILTIILYILIISFVMSIFVIKYFSYKIKPNFNRYVISEIERIITLIINDSINDDLTKIDSNSIFVLNNSGSDKVTIDIDNKKLNQIQRKINNHIEDDVRLVSSGKIKKMDKYFNTMSDIDYETIKGGIVYYIASGNISGNMFTNNLGPKIPIKFSMSGDTISTISNKIQEYGINNALIEIRINVKINMIVNMPYISRKVTIKTSVPIASRIIQGNIPGYYLGNSLR